MKKYAVYLLAAFAIIISVAAYNANAADNASSITDVCDVNGTDYKSESWSNEQYPVIDLFREKEVPLFTANGNIGNIHVNKLAKLILDDNETYTLTDGEKLDLGNGYTLEAKQINIDNEEIWFEFSKDGKYITDQIVSASNEGNRTWTVTLDNVQGENNIVVMKVHIKNLFVGTETRVVWIDGLWLIDYANTTTLKVGNKIGEFTLEKIVSGINTSKMGSLVFENTTGSSVACNVVGTNYKCDSWPNAAANTANTVDTASAADTTTSNNNTYNVVYADYKCESWSDEQYPVIDLFGDKYVPLFNDSENIRDLHVNKLARLVLDSNETYTFKNNEKLNLGNGYALEAKKIDIDNETVWLEFTKDGKFVASQNISINTGENNKTWNVTLDNVEGENNIVVMKVYVNQLFAGVENNIVRIDGVWLIDYANARTLNIGDKLGDFTLKKIIGGVDEADPGSLTFESVSTSNCSEPSDSEKVSAKFTNKSMESSILWCKEFWGYISMKSKQTFC
jgi:S-layer protein (TIGR01567 family)